MVILRFFIKKKSLPCSGVLCGRCRGDEVGVSALLNKCVSCHDASAILIVGLGKTNYATIG